MADIAEDAAKEAGDIFHGAVEDITPAAINDATKAMEANTERIAQDIANGGAPQAAATLDIEEQGAAAAAKAEAEMKQIILEQTPKVNDDIQNLLKTEQADAENAAKNAVNEQKAAGKTVTPEDASNIAKTYSKRAIANSIAKKCWAVLKYSAFGAVALLVMRNFLMKLKSYAIYLVTCDNNKNLTVKYDNSVVKFYEGDMCSVSLNKKYAQNFTALAGKNGTTDDNGLYMKVLKVDGPTMTLQQDVGCPANPVGTGSVSDPVGLLRCQPDLAHDLINGTGEDLNEIMKQAGSAAGTGTKSFWDNFGGSIKIIIYVVIGVVVLSILSKFMLTD